MTERAVKEAGRWKVPKNNVAKLGGDGVGSRQVLEKGDREGPSRVVRAFGDK
jgi:hypothetical protein